MRLIALALALATVLVTASVAFAHQTATRGSVTVTMHVAPDDEPVAGESTTVTVVRVKVRGGSFSFRRCGTKCRLRITDSSGSVVYSGRARRETRVTFPRSGAYKIVFSGRARRSGRNRSFSVPFAIRAN